MSKRTIGAIGAAVGALIGARINDAYHLTGYRISPLASGAVPGRSWVR
jgi:hypothetical protein